MRRYLKDWGLKPNLLHKTLPKSGIVATLLPWNDLNGGKLQHNSPKVFVSNADTKVAVSRAVKAGHLRKQASRLYSRDLTSEPEKIIRRNLRLIDDGYFPGVLQAC